MKSRIDQVANPDVSTFNIAMPQKGRLSIFESICPETNNKESTTKQKKSKTNKNKKAGQKKQRNLRQVTFVERQDMQSCSSMQLSAALGFN